MGTLVRHRTESDRGRRISIDIILVLIYLSIVIIWWTGLAPWEFEFPFPGSHTSTFLI